MTDTSVISSASFEALKRTNTHGAEYWSARDLQTLLGYSQWRSFTNIIQKAMDSCEASGNEIKNHFANTSKRMETGSRREQEDYHLSRFACYLITQNGDPRKPEIAAAQQYFAIQTRKQELSDQEASDRERLGLRKQAGVEFKALSAAAKRAGVQNPMFGVFHDAGYKGLYGGLSSDEIRRHKGIPEKETLLDRMNSTELAANQFRMTQARDKLAREKIRHQSQAIATHKQVGKEVRDAIKRIGGDLPEYIPPAEHIKQVEKRVKSTKPKLALEEKHAVGLLGDEE